MRAGFAKHDITPREPRLMAGFDRRTEPSVGILDELYVSVLAMEDDKGAAFLLCSFDLLGVDRQLCEQVRAAITSATGVEDSRIWVCATHTHSAPSHIFSTGSSYDAEFTEGFVQKAAKTAVEALADLREAAPQIAKTHAVGVSSLRNQGREGAEYPMPLYVTKLQRADDALAFCVFTCHPTVLDEKNRLFSKDIPGAAAAVLPEDTKCIFLNAACADLSTRFTRNGSNPEELARIGGLMGTAIAQAEYAKNDSFGAKICAAQEEILLSRAASLDGEERVALLTALREKHDACEDVQMRREYDSRIAVLERASVAAEKDRRIHIAAVDFGPFALASVPFEVDSKDGNELEAILSETAQKPVYLLCYTGGYDGYLPSGKPLSVNSSYEDIASRYLPQSREQVWECAKRCVLQAKL